MADWRGGYSAEWSVERVNVSTWDDSGSLDGVLEVSVDRDCSDDVPLLETGSMRLDLGSSDFECQWCRVYMTVEESGRERVPMATLLFEKVSSHAEKGVYLVEARGRSVLQPAADRKVPRGSYAPAGCDGAAYVGGLISECTPAPVSVEGSFTIVDDLVFDIGISYLEAAWKVLNAAGWCMQVDGRGGITVREKPTVPSLELSGANAGLLIPGVDDDFSIVDVPNRYYAVDDSEVAVASNEDEASEASYPNRGRWVDYVDTSPVPVNGESLEMYAARKLIEASTITRRFSYTREYWPGVFPFSIVRASLKDNGIEGDLRVISQQLSCGRGVTVSEVSGMEVLA